MLYIFMTMGFALLWGGIIYLLGYWAYRLCFEPDAKEKASRKERARRFADRRGYDV